LNDVDGHDNLVAVVGMAGRFSDAPDVATFWQNLSRGVESVREFSDEELAGRGVSAELRRDPHYVPLGTVLEDIDRFDAAFFNYTPREAEIMDPQQRLFLECAWAALEDAAIDPERERGLISVFAGASMNNYIWSLLAHRDVMASAGGYQVVLANDKDFLATRVSYKLNLKGSSFTVQTACSTSLVAVHLGCQHLLTQQCDVALAGGVSVNVGQGVGYLYRPGMIFSPDGHCRAFDAEARGTISGTGLGIVVLKRYEDAVADGDAIRAVIRGSSVNNDGSMKVGYTAPSVEGQAGVIADALAIADADPSTISYIETHGTGTELGDPIEMEALAQAFRGRAGSAARCAIGSVKTNIGHLDAAAGVAGFIKTVLALEHKQLPPSLHYRTPNPRIDFEHSPFFVNTELVDWESNGSLRRAGISSFGIGGTNAHVVLEEAPAPEESGASRHWQILPLSAKTPAALDDATERLADYLDSRTDLKLPDVAYTLQTGRKPFACRRAVVVEDRQAAIDALRDAGIQVNRLQEPVKRKVAFMFTGQGAQYPGMARGLYDEEQAFRVALDLCAEILTPHLGFDICEAIYPSNGDGQDGGDRLNQTHVTQPVLFAVEYALARLWESWGIVPESMIGHSIGEYVAACLAGVFSLEDALALVASRGHLMQSLPAGSMMAVPVGDKDIDKYISNDISLAVVNGPRSCVVAGSTPHIDELSQRLRDDDIEGRLLRTSHAFHSAMMDPIVDAFVEKARSVAMHEPRIPYVSNLTGTWITPQQATDAAYYGRHLRQTVRFCDGLGELLADEQRVLLEIGPGQTLASLARQMDANQAQRVIHASVRHPSDPQSDQRFILRTLSQLMLADVFIEWQGFYAHERRRRVPLPTYPFQRSRFWIDSPKSVAPRKSRRLDKRPAIQDWIYAPGWKSSVVSTGPPPDAETKKAGSCFLLLADDLGLSDRLAERLQDQGHSVVSAKVGSDFGGDRKNGFRVAPASADDLRAVLEDLRENNSFPDTVIHCWSLTAASKGATDWDGFKRAQGDGFYSVLHLAQAIDALRPDDPLKLIVLGDGVFEITGDEALCAENSTLVSAVTVIAQEHPDIACGYVDIRWPKDEGEVGRELVQQLCDDATQGARERVTALRGRHRWVPHYENITTTRNHAVFVRTGGVYLITGGLGRVGLTLAECLARRCSGARIVLLARSALPPESQWHAWVQKHGDKNATSQKIMGIERLRNAGAEVQVATADVTDEHAMREVVADLEDRWGKLNGVIHAAGNTSAKTFLPVRRMTQSVCEQQFSPKVQGLFVLERVLDGRDLDFCLLTSSLSVVLGGMGYVAYAAANQFMDTFVCSHNRRSDQKWLCVDWDAWRFVEEDVPQTEVARLAMTPEESIEAFERALSSNQERLIVSTADLQARLDQWIRVDPVKASADQARAPRYARPELHSSYAAPANETEQKLAEIWQDMLGIEKVGVQDNFFELGGHSLLGVQLMNRIRAEFDADVDVASLFEGATVRALAKLIMPRGQDEVAELEHSNERGKRRAESRHQMRRRRGQRGGT